MKEQRRALVLTGLALAGILLIMGVIKIGCFIVDKVVESRIDYSQYWAKEEEDMVIEMPEIDVQLLTVNEYSRSGIATERIQNIVIHYTANPGTTAQQNRDYFENLKDTETTKASSNFIIGIAGEIIQCVPTNEVAYASNDANIYSVSIELCHEDETGEFTEATYNSLLALTAYLCDKFDLESEDVIRHYDVTGKLCPLYYVENEEAYEQYHEDLAEVLK